MSNWVLELLRFPANVLIDIQDNERAGKRVCFAAHSEAIKSLPKSPDEINAQIKRSMMLRA